MISPFKELLIPNFAKVVNMSLRSGFRLVEGVVPPGDGIGKRDEMDSSQLCACDIVVSIGERSPE
jgi:hypothetical protein